MPTDKLRLRVLAVCHEPRGETPSKKLYKTLEASPAWCRYFQSVWLIGTTETPHEFWQRIEKHVHPKDYVFIVEVEKYTGFLPKDAWDWISSIRKSKPSA